MSQRWGRSWRYTALNKAPSARGEQGTRSALSASAIASVLDLCAASILQACSRSKAEAPQLHLELCHQDCARNAVGEGLEELVWCQLIGTCGGDLIMVIVERVLGVRNGTGRCSLHLTCG